MDVCNETIITANSASVLLVIFVTNVKKIFWRIFFQQQNFFLHKEKILLFKKLTYEIFTDGKHLEDTLNLFIGLYIKL